MERIDQNQIPDRVDEIRLFAKVRNEAERLPYFLSYYRDLGVSRFFIIDNGSTDETLNLLIERHDCHIFSTTESMSKSEAGMLWIRPLLEQFGLGHWCLIVDADELLIYEGCETVVLSEFCRHLLWRGESAMFCVMIDMYADDDVTPMLYRQGQAFTDLCPYFDREGYQFFHKSVDDIPTVYGGPRLRLFYPELASRSFPARFRRSLCYRVATSPIADHFPALKKIKPPAPPLLSKVPLVYWDHNMRYSSAAHSLSGGRVSEATGALLHFKFIGDFKARFEEELHRKAYFNFGAEYRRYHDGIMRRGGLDFMCEATTRFTGSKQLVELGLVKPIPSFTGAASR